MLVEELREAGVRGRLAYIARDCSFRTRTLPDFRPVRSPRRFEGSACPYGERSVVEVDVGGARFDRAARETAARRHPLVPDDLRFLRSVVVTDVEPLAGGVDAALLEIRLTGRLAALEPGRVVALFAGRRLVATPVFEPIERIAASPDRRYLGVEPGRLLRADGTSVPLPRGLENGGALAFSPDSRWLALARLRNVFLVRLDELETFAARGRSPHVIRLPIAAVDLAWR